MCIGKPAEKNGGKNFMQYKIGEVANILGITAEAIRYYEAQGVITPQKNKESNYRLYSKWDIELLIRARCLRSYGYSIAETVEILNSCELPDISARLQQKEADIEKNIAWSLNLLRRLRELNENIVDSENFIGKYRIEYRPAMYRLENQVGYELKSSPELKKLTRQWIDMVPFIRASARFTKEDLENGSDNFTFGQALNEKYADFFGIKESQHISYLPSVPCIYTAINSNSDIVLTPQRMMPAVKYLHSQGLELGGDIITLISIMRKKDNHYFNYHQVWLPIK
jgi:DNA-binding transcriptional MerR regulator